MIAIGPTTNIAAALACEPRIADRAKFVGMHGWLSEVDIEGEKRGPKPEYNVASDIAACRAVFAAEWDKTITPVETCGMVVLRHDRYRRIRDASGPLVKALLKNYEDWETTWDQYAEVADNDSGTKQPWRHYRSSVLLDTVAIYLAYDESLLNVDRLPIAIDDDGRTRVAAGAPELRVTTSWRDRDRFEEHLVERLTS